MKISDKREVVSKEVPEFEIGDILSFVLDGRLRYAIVMRNVDVDGCQLLNLKNGYPWIRKKAKCLQDLRQLLEEDVDFTQIENITKQCELVIT